MTLEQLRIFVAVADCGHMTRASQALNMTQSAASAAVAALESRHGVLLFDRIGRRLELSEAGRTFLLEAKLVLAQARAAARALDQLAGLERGLIRIAASQTVASYWLPQRMAAFAVAHPAVQLDLDVGNTKHAAQAVLDGLADIGFVEGAIEDQRLDRTSVGGDRLSLYAAPDHRLAMAESVSVEELRQAVWIMREPGSGTRSAFEVEIAERGLDPSALNILLELPSNEAVLAAVANGGSLTAMSDLAAAPHIASGRLRPLAFSLAAREFRALLHRERTPSRAVSAFLRLAQ